MCEKERKKTQTHEKQSGPLPALVADWPLTLIAVVKPDCTSE